MRFRIYIVLSALVILILIAFAIASWFRTREPSYDGRPLSYWLSPVRNPYGKALAAMDGAAARFLWAEMQVTDSPFKLRLVKLARKQPFVPITHVPAEIRRMHAHAMFPAVAEWAATEIPMLID